MNNDLKPEGRQLLVLGHPGHELRIYGWVAQARPLVCILTDGSGSDGAPRLKETLTILQNLGAEIGPICGDFSDRQIYSQILKQDYALFETTRDRLADLIVAREIDTVVCDAIEGYNPTHDLCEVLTRTAVAIATFKTGRPIQHYTYPLMGDPRGADGTAHLAIDLDPAQLEQKVATTLDYAHKAGTTLQKEVDETLQMYGKQAFAREYLFNAAAPGREPERCFEQEKPFYEIYGEKQVAAGLYQFVIRYREHIIPLIDRLSTNEPARPLSCGS